MRKTYCDLTSSLPEKSFALHLSEMELGLISELLNSVNDDRATQLREAVNVRPPG